MALQDYVALPPITAVHLADDGRIPNSRLPLVIFHAAIDPRQASAEAFEDLFEQNGWQPAWRATIFPYHHFHSTSHEVLGIASGTARILVGGDYGREFDIAAGDAIVIPAGVGHKRLLASDDFLAVAAYPPGRDWDVMTGERGERPNADANIDNVPLPDSDPVGGAGGLLTELWR
jgi:uncharacterized protein YjlB